MHEFTYSDRVQGEWFGTKQLLINLIFIPQNIKFYLKKFSSVQTKSMTIIDSPLSLKNREHLFTLYFSNNG